jgi:DNA-binding MarR family transcriptional regulator
VGYFRNATIGGRIESHRRGLVNAQPLYVIAGLETRPERIYSRPVAKKVVRVRETRRARQARELLVHLDALAERLRPSRRPVDRRAAPCSPQELFALNTIGRREQLTMTDLAAAMRVPLSTASRVVDRLAVNGLVVRTPLAHDRRVVHVGFSRRGRRINQFVAASRQAAAIELLEAVGAPEAGILLAALERMVNGRQPAKPT